MWGVSSTKDDMDFGWYMYGSSGQHHHSSPTTPTKRFHWNRWILFHYLLPVTWAILIDYKVELAGPFWLKHPLGSRFYLIVHPSIVQLHAKAYKEDSQRNLSTMNCLRVYYVDQHCDRFSRWVQAPAWSYGYALPVFWYQQWDRIATTRITTDGRWCSTHARLGHGIVGGGRRVRSHRPAWKYSSPGLQDWLKQLVPAKAAPLHKAEHTLAHIASTVKVLRLTTTVQFEIATAFRPVRGADNVARGQTLDEVFRLMGIGSLPDRSLAQPHWQRTWNTSTWNVRSWIMKCQSLDTAKESSGLWTFQSLVAILPAYSAEHRTPELMRRVSARHILPLWPPLCSQTSSHAHIVLMNRSRRRTPFDCGTSPTAMSLRSPLLSEEQMFKLLKGPTIDYYFIKFRASNFEMQGYSNSQPMRTLPYGFSPICLSHDLTPLIRGSIRRLKTRQRSLVVVVGFCTESTPINWW